MIPQRWRSALAVASLAFGGCAHAPAGKPEPRFDFSRVRAVAVTDVAGSDGGVVTQELIRQLVAWGFTVTSEPARADAVLSGKVVEYRPDEKMIVFLGHATISGVNEQPVPVTNPVVPLSGNPLRQDGQPAGQPAAQMVSSHAYAAVQLTLSDPKTRKILWTDGYSYEGLSMALTLKAATETLAASLRRVLPPTPAPKAS